MAADNKYDLAFDLGYTRITHIITLTYIHTHRHTHSLIISRQGTRKNFQDINHYPSLIIIMHAMTQLIIITK